MGFINLAEKTVQAKLVYYGCGMGGKTSSLQAVHEIMCPRNEVQLLSIKTEEDATLLFDFLPIDLGEVEGFKIKIQGFTVPGQPKYRRMRKFVLSGADAVVFVVDSESSRLEENIQSLHSLHENLKGNGLDPLSIPLVLQYNKRDLEDILTEKELDRHFCYRDDLETFPSVATKGHGVFETFVHAAGLLVEAKVKLYGLGRGHVDPATVAESARARLWEIRDRVQAEVAREQRAAAAGASTPGSGKHRAVELTFDEDGRPAKPASVPAADAGDDDPVFDDDLGEVFTDSMLDVDIDFGEDAKIDFEASPAPDDEVEPTPALLDAAVESNLELAQMYGELERTKSLLEAKNRELVEATQNTVHDLNRPLSAIRLMFSSMKKGFLGELPTAHQAIENGLSAVQQMDRLIEDLLASSRLDFDGFDMEFREVDLGLLLTKVVNVLRYEFDEHSVGLRIEPMPVVTCDEWAMTKVFCNLLGNAIQYRHPERPPRIWVSADQGDDHWLVRVRDNGIGIPSGDIPRLFHRFQRGGNTGGVSGTGLGLHIIREVVLGHGGDVWVESDEGESTTFSLRLPCKPIQPLHSPLTGVENDFVTAIQAVGSLIEQVPTDAR